MTDKKNGFGDCNVTIDLGGRQITLKFTMKTALEITDGVGFEGRLKQFTNKEFRAMAEMIQIASGGRYDDAKDGEPPLSIEDITEGMLKTGLYVVSRKLDRFLIFLMSGGNPEAMVQQEEDKPVDPQPTA